MKQFKLFLWIAGLMFLEMILTVFVNIRGIVPGLLLSFAIAYAAYERSLKSVIWVSVICGIIESSAGADEFTVVMVAFVMGAALTYMSYDAPHRPAGAVRAAAGAAVVTAAENAALYTAALSFDAAVFTVRTLPVALLNAGAAVLMYAAFTKCFNIKDTVKKLIIS